MVSDTVKLKILWVVLQSSISLRQSLKLQLLLSVFNWFLLTQWTTVLKRIKVNDYCKQYVREITGTRFHNTTMPINNSLIIQILYQHSDRVKRVYR